MICLFALIGQVRSVSLVFFSSRFMYFGLGKKQSDLNRNSQCTWAQVVAHDLQSTDISRAPADLLRTAAAGFSGCRDSDFFANLDEPDYLRNPSQEANSIERL